LSKRTPLFLIFLVVFIDLLGFGILIPILPTFATKDLGMNETAIGIAIALYSFVQFLFNPIFGKLSDKHGRKPIIVICLLLNAAGYIIFAYSHSFAMLLFSRIVGGIGGSSVSVAYAYIADVTTKENRSKGMGVIGAAFGLGFVFGPFFGGILAKFGYDIAGFGSAGFSFLAFLSTVFLLPESHKHINKELKIEKKLFDIAAFKKVLARSDLGILVILYFILTFSMANIYGTFALLGYKVYGFSDLQNGYIFGIVGLVGALVQGGLIRVVSKHIPDLKLVAIGSFLMMIGLGLLPYGGNFLGLAIITVILALGTGVLQPTLLSLVSKVTTDKEQGITLGVNQSLSSFARVLGPLWGGFAFEFLGYAFPFLTGAAFTVLIFFIALTYLPKKINLEESELSA